MECCRALQGGDEGYFATIQIGLGESEIARQDGGIFEVIWAYLIWTMINLKTWDLGSVLKNLFSFDKVKPVGPVLSVLIIVLFSLAVFTVFNFASALFETTPN